MAGSDISPVMIKVVDAAVQKAYVQRKISWMEIYAGEKATQVFTVKMYGFQTKL